MLKILPLNFDIDQDGILYSGVTVLSIYMLNLLKEYSEN